MSERNAADRSGEPPQPATGEDRRALWRKLEKLRMAMVATHDVAGEMTARPLTTQQVEDDGTAWFFVPLDGGVSEELARDARALDLLRGQQARTQVAILIVARPQLGLADSNGILGASPSRHLHEQQGDQG